MRAEKNYFILMRQSFETGVTTRESLGAENEIFFSAGSFAETLSAHQKKTQLNLYAIVSHQRKTKHKEVVSLYLFLNILLYVKYPLELHVCVCVCVYSRKGFSDLVKFYHLFSPCWQNNQHLASLFFKRKSFGVHEHASGISFSNALQYTNSFAN